MEPKKRELRLLRKYGDLVITGFIVIVTLLITSSLIIQGASTLLKQCKVGKLTHEKCRDMIRVRSVKCWNGNMIHICCQFPLRHNFQLERQRWFRMVTLWGNLISPSCTLRVLCEQSCKDGLIGRAQASYPEVLETDSQENKRYVEAFSAGEASSCYKTPETFRQFWKETSGCELYCGRKYPKCKKELELSLFIRHYYKLARPMHLLGMESFRVYWLTRDGLIASLHLQAKTVIIKGIRRIHQM